MVIRDILKDAVTKLRLSNNNNPIFEAHQILKSALNLSESDLLIKGDQKLTTIQIQTINDMLERRIKKEPLQYILGSQEFMSLEFMVTPNTLIPRADTETLVEYLLEEMQNKTFSLLDIGTGTGCIPLSIAYYNQNAAVRGIDISVEALEIAKKNCEQLNLKDRAVFEQIDILTKTPSGKFDIVTSNPPYIKSCEIPKLQDDVKNYEPHLALDGGADGLMFYRRICELAHTLLNKDGMLVFEIGFDQGKAVFELVQEKFCEVEIIKDLCKNDRVVVGKRLKL